MVRDVNQDIQGAVCLMINSNARTHTAWETGHVNALIRRHIIGTALTTYAKNVSVTIILVSGEYNCATTAKNHRDFVIVCVKNVSVAIIV